MSIPGQPRLRTMTLDITTMRLANQRISAAACQTPEEVVAWMGALQAQDYLMSLWAVGLRTAGCTEKDVEAAVSDRKIVRTWPMRRTIHWVPAADARWMVRLSAERIIHTYAAHMPRLGLSEEIISKSRKVVTKALAGGKQLTRTDLYERFEAAKIPTDKSRGIHILWRLGQEARICFGPRSGKQQTFALLDEWVPRHNEPSRDEAVAEVARRYFRSHGPATVQDLSWWSGLKAADVKAGIAAIRDELAEETLDGRTYYLNQKQPRPPRKGHGVYFLPAFDEYMLSYKNRSAVIDPDHAPKVNRGLNGMYRPIIVINGRIEGTWMRTIERDSVNISVHPFDRFGAATRKAAAAQARRYAGFLGLPANLE